MASVKEATVENRKEDDAKKRLTYYLDGCRAILEADYLKDKNFLINMWKIWLASPLNYTNFDFY